MHGKRRILEKKRALMIKYTPASERNLSLFRTPYEQHLLPDNPWVQMEAIVPWDELAKIFIKSMSSDKGRASVDLRIVIGAMLVKHLEGLSDEDTIRYIQENIYAQFFVGLPTFQAEPIFVPSLFVEIRKRLGPEGSMRFNDLVLQHAVRLGAIKHKQKRNQQRSDDKDGGGQQSPDKSSEAITQSIEPSDQMSVSDENPQPNRGTLKVDATVAPQHIGYPTDTRLLAEAREYSEGLIDRLYEGSHNLWDKKPRTYRKIAAKKYLAFSKKRTRSGSIIKKARKQQLNYLKRNLKTIDKMLNKLEESGQPIPFAHKDLKRLWVIQELYRQQKILASDNRRSISDRIVNIAQPYVRPVVRGKAGANVEFGAKINLSETEGFCRTDQIDFTPFAEGTLLIEQIEAYKALYGYYPELVLADKAYLSMENRNYLKAKGIRHAGPPLGRPPAMSAEEKRKRKKEQNKRSEIEGKFGQAKMKYGLDDIRMKRADTSKVAIIFIFVALNIIKLARAFYCFFSRVLSGIRAYDVSKLTLRFISGIEYMGCGLKVNPGYHFVGIRA